MADTKATRELLSEGVVILGSILLAFAIDAAWDARQERRVESVVVSAVASEVRANQESLTGVLASTDESLARLDRFMNLTPTRLGQVEPAEVPQLVRLSLAADHEPILGAATALLQSPATDASGLVVREWVARWVQSLRSLNVERAVLQRRQESLQQELARYASRYPDGGVAPTDVMLMRARDPELIRELRSDELLVAAVVEKGHAQWSYARRLRSVLALSDTIAAALENSTAGDR
jgi:hypothetical protein